MTVAIDTTHWAYVGTGGAGPFAYNSRVFAKTDLTVTVSGAVKTVDVDYTVSGVGADEGGAVTFISGSYPASGADIAIDVDIPATQEKTFSDPDVQDAFDKLTRLLQRANRRIADLEARPSGGITDPWLSRQGGYVPGKVYTGTRNCSGSALALAANTLYFMGMIVGADHAWASICVNISTAAAAGKKLRLGLYAVKDGVPTTLIFDAGEIAADVTGQREIAITQDIPPGFYFAAVISDGTPTVYGAGATNVAYLTYGYNDSIGVALSLAPYASQTYGALPLTAPAVTWGGGNEPIIALKA